MRKTTQLGGLLLVLAFVLPSPAVAGPIGIGASPVIAPVTQGPIQDLVVDPFSYRLSLDCPNCGAGSVVRWYDNPQLVYLNTGSQGWKVFKVNAVGALTNASGLVTYLDQNVRTLGLPPSSLTFDDISSSGFFDDHNRDNGNTNPSPVPEPSTLILLGSSVGLLGVRKRVLAFRTVRR
ncbi:MAG TPA: PEP-CTERM sorting domain-containing protein [Vicinamibacterales bacterium]|jgi:hypothetical protein